MTRLKLKLKLKLVAQTKTITMLELRERAEEVVKAVERGQTMILTYRGRAVMRLVPIPLESVDPNDAFYQLADLATRRGGSMTNDEIDRLVYGS